MLGSVELDARCFMSNPKYPEQMTVEFNLVYHFMLYNIIYLNNLYNLGITSTVFFRCHKKPTLADSFCVDSIHRRERVFSLTHQ